MTFLPASPRKRRRLARIAILVAALVLIALAIAFVRPPKQENIHGDPLEAGQAYTPPKEVRVTPQMRREINATLDAFVPAAVQRKNPDAAYALATRTLRESATPQEWKRGEIPVFPFEAKGRTFHGWTLNFSIPNNVNVDLMVPASNREKELNAIAYTVDLRRRNGKWRVNEFYPTAMFRRTAAANGSRIVAQPDLAPTPKIEGATHTGKDATERYVAMVPLLIAGLGVALVFGVFLVQYLRGRRAERAYAAGRL